MAPPQQHRRLMIGAESMVRKGFWSEEEDYFGGQKNLQTTCPTCSPLSQQKQAKILTRINGRFAAQIRRIALATDTSSAVAVKEDRIRHNHIAASALVTPCEGSIPL